MILIEARNIESLSRKRRWPGVGLGVGVTVIVGLKVGVIVGVIDGLNVAVGVIVGVRVGVRVGVWACATTVNAMKRMDESDWSNNLFLSMPFIHSRLESAFHSDTAFFFLRPFLFSSANAS